MTVKKSGNNIILEVSVDDMTKWLKDNWQYLLGLALTFITAWYSFDRRMSLMEANYDRQQEQIQVILLNEKEFVTKRELDQNITPRLDRMEGKLDTLLQVKGER